MLAVSTPMPAIPPRPEPVVAGFAGGTAAGEAEIGRHPRIEAFPATAQEIGFASDRGIHMQGDPADFYCRVVSGIVRICKATEDGRRQIAAFPGPGDLFGWAGYDRYAYAAEAVTDVVLLRWPRRAMEQAIVDDPELGRQILAVLFRQLADFQDHLLLVGRMQAHERIAAFLLAHGRRHARDRRRFPLPMSRKDIADHLGLTVETVSRTMHGFVARGLITFAPGRIVQIRDGEALARLADHAAG